MSFLGELWDNTAGGLLWKPLKKATGLTDAQMIGIGAMAVGAPYALPALGGASGSLTGGLMNFSGAQAAAPIVDKSIAASGAAQGGLLDTVMGAGKTALGGLKEYGPAGANVASAVMQAGGQGQQMQAPQMQPVQSNPGAFTGLLGPTDQFDPQKRRQAQEMAMQGLLGGYRG